MCIRDRDYTAAIAQMEKKYSQDKLLQKHIRYLLTTYGNDAQIIIDQYNNKLSQNKQSSSKELLVEAQLEYSIEYELVADVMDFIDRRSGWLYFHIADAKKYLEFVTRQLAEHLGQNENWIQYQISEAQEIINRNSLVEIK